MTKLVFVANGQKFNTYAKAREVSTLVDVECIDNWIDPTETATSEKILAEHKAKLAHLNTPELCALRKRVK